MSVKLVQVCAMDVISIISYFPNLTDLPRVLRMSKTSVHIFHLSFKENRRLLLCTVFLLKQIISDILICISPVPWSGEIISKIFSTIAMVEDVMEIISSLHWPEICKLNYQKRFVSVNKQYRTTTSCYLLLTGEQCQKRFWTSVKHSVWCNMWKCYNKHLLIFHASLSGAANPQGVTAPGRTGNLWTGDPENQDGAKP